MSLDGLRAWIGEVERKLGMRTRVFLVLAVLAIGVGGAAIYLAVDARENSVSESDVQALQEDLEGRIAAGGGSAAGTDAAQLEAELNALKAEVAELRSGGGEPNKDKGASESKGGTGSSGGTGESSSDAESGAGEGAKLQELLQRSKEKTEESE